MPASLEVSRHLCACDSTDAHCRTRAFLKKIFVVLHLAVSPRVHKPLVSRDGGAGRKEQQQWLFPTGPFVSVPWADTCSGSLWIWDLWPCPGSGGVCVGGGRCCRWVSTYKSLGDDKKLGFCQVWLIHAGCGRSEVIPDLPPLFLHQIAATEVNIAPYWGE